MSEKRDDGNMTEFTIRRIRNEIIEECAKAAEGEYVGEDGSPCNEPDISYNMAIDHAADAIRQLKR